MLDLSHAPAAVSEKDSFGKLQAPSRDPPGPLSAKKIRTEEKKAPRRLNGEGASSGNSRQLQSPAAPSPQSYGSPGSWSFAALSAAPSPSSARSSFSFSAGTAVPSSVSASSSQPVPRKLLVQFSGWVMVREQDGITGVGPWAPGGLMLCLRSSSYHLSFGGAFSLLQDNSGNVST